jgi:hydroxypyruvate reductase
MPGKEDSLKEKGMQILWASLKASDPETAIINHLKVKDQKIRAGDYTYDIKDIERIYVVGFGKASSSMAKAVEKILGERIDKGMVITKEGYVEKLSRIDLVEAAHPIPDENGIQSTEKIINLLKDAGKRDLIICLISGGGSALLVAPTPGITLEEKKRLTDLLLRSGACIEEINAVRKHISRVKGGRLAQLTSPAKVVSLILSDVVGDRLDSIASGPTAPDTTTFSDCIDILKKYGLLEKVPQSIRKHLEENIDKKEMETPKPGEPLFQNVKNVIVGSNSLALKAADKKARELRFNTSILSDAIIGDTTEAAIEQSQLAKRVKEKGEPVSPPACIISGGETTVQVKGKGLGGRNQEFALVSGMQIKGMDDVVILSVNTDGTDGPTDAAGAICDGKTVEKAKNLNLNPKKYLENNDSYHFFEKIGDLIKTGPTKTNVMDIHLILVG